MATGTEPAQYAAAITPADSTQLTHPVRAIYVGGAGNIALTTTGGDTVTLNGVLAGTILPIQARIIASTNTTATNLVAIW